MATSRSIFAVLAGIALLAAGCGVSSTPAPALQVHGQDIGAGDANVVVTQDGVAVGDAVVTVNGRVIPLADAAMGHYSGAYPIVGTWDPAHAVWDPTGEAVQLVVTRGPSRVTGTGAIPETPVLTAPANGSAVGPDGSIALTWTSRMDPDRFVVGVQWLCDPTTGVGMDFVAPGSSRSLAIPGSALPYGAGPCPIAGQDLAVSVLAYDDGALAGDYEAFTPYPGMNVRVQSSPVAVVTSHVGAAPGR